MIKRYLECGKIVSTHGVHGELRVQPWCDGPGFLLDFPTLYLDGGGRPVEVEQARVHGNMALLKLKGISGVDQAAALRGKVLYIDREDAPPPKEGEFFIQDLLGLRVEDADTGADYGILSGVFPTGANDVYELTAPDGLRRLVPAIRQVVVSTDPEGGIMRIRPLKGLFDDAD